MGSDSTAGSPSASAGWGSGTQGSSACASIGSASTGSAGGSAGSDTGAASSEGCSLAGSSRAGQLGVDGGEIVAHGSFSSVISRPCRCWSEVVLRGYVVDGGAAHGSSAGVAAEGAGGGVNACSGTARGALH